MIEIKNFKKNNIYYQNDYVIDTIGRDKVNSYINLLVKQLISKGELENSVKTNLAVLFVRIYYLVKLKFSDIIKRAD